MDAEWWSTASYQEHSEARDRRESDYYDSRAAASPGWEHETLHEAPGYAQRDFSPRAASPAYAQQRPSSGHYHQQQQQRDSSPSTQNHQQHTSLPRDASPSPRSLRAPLPDAARPSSPRPGGAEHEDPWLRGRGPAPSPRQSSPRSHPASARPSQLGDVRPQWTQRTTAGRAKLHVDDCNWELAERHRQLRSERERYRGEWRSHVALKNKYDTAVKREQTLTHLQRVKEASRAEVEEKGQQRKAESTQLRRMHSDQRTQWEEYGRYLQGTFTNDGARRARRQLEGERVDEAELRRQEKEVHRHERAHELSQRVVSNREKAQRLRRENGLAVRSVSAAELRSRQLVAEEMKQAEGERDGYR